MEFKQHSQNDIMIHLSINTDVHTMNLLIDSAYLGNLTTFDVSSITNETFLTQINGAKLIALQSELAEITQRLLSSRNKSSKPNVKCAFGGQVYDLDFRNDYDFQICFLVGFYDLVTISICHSGTVYVFNKDFPNLLNTEKAGPFLRAKGPLTKEDIYIGIVALYSDSVLKLPFTMEILEDGIVNMINLGLATYNDDQKTYKLTARGYMLF